MKKRLTCSHLILFREWTCDIVQVLHWHGACFTYFSYFDLRWQCESSWWSFYDDTASLHVWLLLWNCVKCGSNWLRILRDGKSNLLHEMISERARLSAQRLGPLCEIIKVRRDHPISRKAWRHSGKNKRTILLPWSRDTGVSRVALRTAFNFVACYNFLFWCNFHLLWGPLSALAAA
jgi:hypothetical protein